MVDGAWAETADAPFCWAGDAVATPVVGASDEVRKCCQPDVDFFDASIGGIDSSAQLPPRSPGCGWRLAFFLICIAPICLMK